MRIRILKRVGLPRGEQYDHLRDNPMWRGATLKPGQEHRAEMFPDGQVCVVFGAGRRMGVKPAEVEFIDAADREEYERRRLRVKG